MSIRVAGDPRIDFRGVLRKLANGVAKALDDAGEGEAAAAVKSFQFRDLRGKASTDKAADATDMREAQQQLGHKSVKTTEIYLRTRAGEKRHALEA